MLYFNVLTNSLPWRACPALAGGRGGYHPSAACPTTIGQAGVPVCRHECFMCLKFCNSLKVKQFQNFRTHGTASLSHEFFSPSFGVYLLKEFMFVS